MDAASVEFFQKLMEVHQFIVLPPLDLLEYTHRSGVIPSHVYESVRGSVKKGLIMNRKHLHDDARAVVCFTQVQSAGFKLNEVNQEKYNNRVVHCIARLLCKVCKLPSKWDDGVHRDMMRRGCAHPGRSLVRTE